VPQHEIEPFRLITVVPRYILSNQSEKIQFVPIYVNPTNKINYSHSTIPNPIYRKKHSPATIKNKTNEEKCLQSGSMTLSMIRKIKIMPEGLNIVSTG
jgi:hypothetical protein